VDKEIFGSAISMIKKQVFMGVKVKTTSMRSMNK
jgi:hypothetical protein